MDRRRHDRLPEVREPVAAILEVGDAWLDAGIVPFSTLNYLDDPEYWEQWFPADFITEMREQIRSGSTACSS